MWRQWADELPLFEASVELDPTLDKWIANAAWQISRSARRQKATIYEDDFYATEKQEDEVPQQSEEDMLKEATKIEESWPHGEKKGGKGEGEKGRE